MAKKKKDAPRAVGRATLEYRRDLYETALGMHCTRVRRAARTADVIHLVAKRLADEREDERAARDLFSRIEAAIGESTREQAHGTPRMELDYLDAYLQIYLPHEWRGARVSRWAHERPSVDALIAFLERATEGENAIRESEAPTFAGVVAKDDERVRRLAAARVADETAHLRAASS